MVPPPWNIAISWCGGTLPDPSLHLQSPGCLDYDATQKRWVWLYAHEAKKLRFQRSYAQFPKELHPIVIGAFFLRTKETL
ncbi:MAG TPA: hypothetical protein VKP69_31560, partial [Isosphaeraceae bacterium]|nr:hypothetical protein [Isosphaeraceae bacterium]